MKKLITILLAMAMLLTPTACIGDCGSAFDFCAPDGFSDLFCASDGFGDLASGLEGLEEWVQNIVPEIKYDDEGNVIVGDDGNGGKQPSVTTTTPPAGGGGQQPPEVGGGQQPPEGGGGQQPPVVTTTTPPPDGGGQEQPPEVGGGQPPVVITTPPVVTTPPPAGGRTPDETTSGYYVTSPQGIIVELDKEIYAAGETMTVTVHNLSWFSKMMGAFIAMYDKDAAHKDGHYGHQYPTANYSVLYFTAPEYVGEYEIRLFMRKDDYSDISFAVSVPFRVE